MSNLTAVLTGIIPPILPIVLILIVLIARKKSEYYTDTVLNYFYIPLIVFAIKDIIFSTIIYNKNLHMAFENYQSITIKAFLLEEPLIFSLQYIPLILGLLIFIGVLLKLIEVTKKEMLTFVIINIIIGVFFIVGAAFLNLHSALYVYFIVACIDYCMVPDSFVTGILRNRYLFDSQ